MSPEIDGNFKPQSLFGTYACAHKVSGARVAIAVEEGGGGNGRAVGRSAVDKVTTAGEVDEAAAAAKADDGVLPLVRVGGVLRH